MKQKKLQPILDSRHLKILSVKKDELKDCIVFVILDEDKYGYYDLGQLRNLAEGLDKLEPSACYVISLKKMHFAIYDQSEIKNRDLIITVTHPDDLDVDTDEIERRFKTAFSAARSIKFVHNYGEVDWRS